ncbi:RsmB/NOP family class I SAM-dependent RNA methyltransferase [Rhodobacteraceae bacterium 63075]|nr:RsmB/NOP family class I SAM-dependent RNA methyltransferase [Rhodobacteraceae bacterium 63075]
MRPEARIAAAIEVLDSHLDGVPAEKALLNWARASRFAGSKDRAAVRDHVFQAVRCQRSYAALGGAQGAPTGRQLMIGALRAEGQNPQASFTGEGHAPTPLDAAEIAAGRRPEPGAEAADMPDWLWPHLAGSLGADAPREAELLRHRAPAFLRVNLRRADAAQAIEALARDAIQARPHALAGTALEVTEGARRIAQSAAFAEGLVELQDAASQAVVEALPLKGARRILDYCAGGGGKALAMAALCDADIAAHDVAPERMKDIPDRAARAGVPIRPLAPEALAAEGGFDLVLCDAPCSGSGAWRRAPEGKWRLTQDRLDQLNDVQLDVLSQASGLVNEGGALAYATCSLLDEENQGLARRFAGQSGQWKITSSRNWRPSDGADGFHLTIFKRV